MAFSVNTNIASLQSQEYIRQNSDFQTKTIGRVTSGLRIISSGDDAAGLAIANGLRSDQAVLMQGVRNANDGLSQLQIIDGGMNNISKLLDRARTLATQSASGTFTGSRDVLNSEFNSVIGEIDRQAQAIGLNTGGSFAKSLSVFVGGGKGSTGAAAITNGAVSVDLSKSTIDANSLGLKGVQAAGVSTVDIGTGGGNTTVAKIIDDATNKGSLAASGFTDFYFRGAGFSDANRVKVSVNLSGVTDVDTLVTNINAAIDAAGNGASQYATAFKNAGVRAKVQYTTGAGGAVTKQLAFTSSNSAFQVAAGDRMANALMGNLAGAGAAPGAALSNTVTGDTNVAAATTFNANGNVIVRVQGGGLASPVDLTLAVTTADNGATAFDKLSTAVQQNSALQAAGITVSYAGGANPIVFSNSHGERFDIGAAGDTDNILGLGSFRLSDGDSGGTYDYTTTTANATGTYAAAAERLEFSFGPGLGETVSLNLTPLAATIAGATNALNAAFAANSTMAAAGMSASNDGTVITIASSNGTRFRLNSVGATNVFGFNDGAAYTGVQFGGNARGADTSVTTTASGGSYQTSLLGFTNMNAGDDDQTISITANNDSGVEQSIAIKLQNDSTAKTGSDVDSTVAAINAALQQSNNATLQKIVAVKEKANAAGAEGIRFMSTGSFKVGVGTNASASGINGASVQGSVQTATIQGDGSTADILSQTTAQTAVTALATAVATLGNAQAVVGKGQNQFNYAVNLAQSQLGNLAASESRIRDADLASEAANLTKAQITLQAGIAALAQANSAPQAILSLLRG